MKLSEIFDPLTLNESKKKPLAVIIKGNPVYLNNHKKWADTFYNHIKKILVSHGYRVKFDAGKDFTMPDKNAELWIGHSRGIDRLRFAPKKIHTIELKTKSNDGDAYNHYIASKTDIKNLEKVITEYFIITTEEELLNERFSHITSQ